MDARTCAVCDWPLEARVIVVRVGGQAVEVCCDECAAKLREACAAAAAAGDGPATFTRR